MRKYLVPLWMVHVAKLLGKGSRSEELYAITPGFPCGGEEET